MGYVLFSEMSRFRGWILLVTAAILSATGCGGKYRGAAKPPASPPIVGTAITPAERGNACHQIAGQLPDTSINDDTAAASSWRRAFARGAEYRCVIQATIPPVRLLIVGHSTDEWLDSLIIVPDSAGAPPGQSLILESAIPPEWSTDVVRMLDLDADGYNDLLVGDIWGATGNTTYHVWRFNPLMRQFVEDSELSDVFNPSPMPGAACVHTHSNSSVADGEAALLCLRNGHWVADSIETSTWDRKAHVIVHEVRARKGDSLVVVKRTARPDSIP